jgi:hypothetical protein
VRLRSLRGIREAGMTEPTPELLEACKEYIHTCGGCASNYYSLAAFVAECELAANEAMGLREFLSTPSGEIMLQSLKAIGVEFICDESGPGWINRRALAAEPKEKP